MATEVTMNSNVASDLTLWIPEIWSRKVYEEAKAKHFWQRFSGPEGSGMPFIIKTELLTNPGDTINISQLAHLTGAGVTGETRLRGQEEKLSLAQVQIIPEWNRHAVSDTAKASKQIMHPFRQKASVALAYWMGSKFDTSAWTAARTTASCGFEATTIDQVFGNNGTSLDDLDSADTFGVAEIRKGSAILESKNIQKVSVPGMPAGEGYYLCFINPWQAYSLKSDTEWIANHQSASERGATNPLFTGALGEIDGVIIHSTTQCTRVENANSPAIYTARAVMVGQEAICRGLNEDIVWSEQIDDYEFEHGIAVRAAWQDKVLSANACVHIVTAAIAQGA
jgi:N4-gp56 family major capsid protein